MESAATAVKVAAKAATKEWYFIFAKDKERQDMDDIENKKTYVV